MSVEDPLSWRSYADEDLHAARVLEERGGIETLAHTISFHAHQSAEKYLKGLLALHEGQEPPKIHNLRLLLTRVGEYAPELNTPGLEDAANALDQFYIPSRYPLEIGGPTGPITAQEATEALA